MKNRIYIPSNFTFPQIFANAKSICEEHNIDLLEVEEKICREHTLLNRSILSLLSPLGYGLGVRKADFRIIPTKVVAYVGYSGDYSLYFKKGLKSIDKIGVRNPDDYITHISKILLSERYDIEADFVKTNLDLPEALEEYEAVLSRERNRDFHSLDICEDWFDTFEIPLIFATWVTRNEEEPEDIIELTRKFADKNLIDEIAISTNSGLGEEHHNREGQILTKWDDDIQNAYEQTLELLYYHRLITEIPAIKIYGID